MCISHLKLRGLKQQLFIYTPKPAEHGCRLGPAIYLGFSASRPQMANLYMFCSDHSKTRDVKESHMAKVLAVISIVYQKCRQTCIFLQRQHPWNNKKFIGHNLPDSPDFLGIQPRQTHVLSLQSYANITTQISHCTVDVCACMYKSYRIAERAHIQVQAVLKRPDSGWRRWELVDMQKELGVGVWYLHLLDVVWEL